MGRRDAIVRRSKEAIELEQAIKTGYELQGKRPDITLKKSFAPSSVGYAHNQCPRLWWEKFQGVEWDETLDWVSVCRMLYGTEAHARIQKALELAGYAVEIEKELTWDDPPIRSFMDILLTIGGEEYPGEIKTTMPEAFPYRKLRGAPGYQLIQLLLYMWILGKKKGFFLIENRANGEVHAVEVLMDETNTELVNYVLDWLRNIYHAVQTNQTPTRPFREKSKMCKHCPIRKACWEGDDGTLVIDPLKVPK